MIDTAQNSLEFWQWDEEAAMRFAAGALADPTNPRHATAKVPGPVTEACWRLVALLEYLADLDGAR